MEQQKEQALTFQCQNCGGTIKWNIAKQQLECVSCRAPFVPENRYGPIQEHDYNSFLASEQQEQTFPGETLVTCSTCGAQMTFGQQDTAKVCPMCGSSQVMEHRQIAGVAPDGLIPFRVDKTTAQLCFRQWISSLTFAPNRLKKAVQQGKLEAVYLPFWTFDTQTEASYSGQGGDTRQDDEGHSYTDWTSVRGHLSVFFDDLAICAATGPVQALIGGILPYSTQNGSVPYDSAYLSGFSAQRYSVKADQAFEQAAQGIRTYLNQQAEQEIKDRGYDSARVEHLDVHFYNVGYKHILVPAWVSSFFYQGKSYLYLINGETGKVSGKRPYSALKILAACVGLIAVITIIVLLLGGSPQ